MAKKYRLEALLKLKLREKKNAEMNLAKALMSLKEAREKLEELRKERKKIQTRKKEARQKWIKK